MKGYVKEFGGKPRSTAIGLREKTDLATAAMVNSMAAYLLLLLETRKA